MPKRRERQDHQDQRDNDGDDSAVKRSRPEPRRRKKHLYVVLDDWKKGLSVHKIDTDSFDSDSDDSDSDSHRRPRVPVAGRLPEPLALRLEAAGHPTEVLFTAMDTKIFVVSEESSGQTTPALVYDTETGGLATVPAHLLKCDFSFVVAARGTLYAFSFPRDNQQQSFQVMSWAPTSSSSSLNEQDNTREGYPSQDRQQDRSWTSLPGPPPPSANEFIVAYAVHSDGRTIFMTTENTPSGIKS